MWRESEYSFVCIKPGRGQNIALSVLSLGEGQDIALSVLSLGEGQDIALSVLSLEGVRI